MYMKKLIFTGFLILSSIVAYAQNPAIVFLQADANVDMYEFITLRRANLNGVSIRDAGICTAGQFRTNEPDILSLTGPSYTDVPAGTMFYVKLASGSADSSVRDGRVVIVDAMALNNVNSNPTGDQLIAYSGPAIGETNCGSATGTNTFLSGFNWGNTGWTSGSTSSNDSKAPGTAYDFSFSDNTFNKVRYSGTIVGNEAALVANINNATNWTGAATGDGVLSLKDILFNESNYSSGAAVVTPALTSATINLSSLVFGGTTVDTRYAVIISLNTAPSLPVDRYTCYTGIAPTVLGSPSVVASVTGQTATDFCGTTAQGTGQIVYFDYALPTALTITGLQANANYSYSVVAVNGNGYTANFSSTAYNSSFSTGTLPTTSLEFTPNQSTVNENVGTVSLPITLSNPSTTVATTVQVAITGGTGSAADVANYTTQTVIFPANTTSGTVTVNVTDDLLVEGTETVVFTLQNISGGQGTPVIGTNAAYTLTITDNDAIVDDTEVSFSVTPTSVTEDVGLVGVVLEITNPSPTQATTVEVQITGGTGTAADVDNYITQTITFPAGSNALQPLSVVVTNDLFFEPTETINFAIRNISGGQGNAVIVADSTFTLTIVDNDIPNIVINEIHYNPSEASGSPDAQYEFIELYNAEPIAVDLGGYYFSQGVTYTFPANTIINPSQYIIVAINAPTYSGQGYDVYQWTGGDLDNLGETVEFKTLGDLVVDVVTYDEVAPWPTGANNTGPSLELIDEPLDNALAQNWRANGPKNGTPGNPNTPLSVAEDMLNSQVQVYGSGTTVYVQLNNSFNGNISLNVIDMAGRVVGTMANINGSQSIDLGQLSAGIYVVQCVSKNAIITKKVVLGY
jgi:Lamin Tail Domain/Calx-beta domain/Secretion system C-terminal sorting domain